MMLTEKIPDIQDADKPSEPVATGLHIETKVSRKSHKAMISEITLICPQNSKSGFGGKLRKVHATRISNALDMQEKSVGLKSLQPKT